MNHPRSERGVLTNMTLLVALFCVCDAALPQVIETSLFTNNRIRQCSPGPACIGGDPTLQLQTDFDLGETGFVSTFVGDAALGAQAATTAGYGGPSLTPSLSVYAYTSGPQRYTVGAAGFQRYEFLADGEITITGSLTYSQTGQVDPFSVNARGVVRGSLFLFQMENGEFDLSNCSLFTSIDAPNLGSTIFTCLSLNGQPLFPGGPLVEFVGLENYEEVAFDTGLAPVTGGATTVTLTVSGQAGDVFFLGANQGTLAHLGGFGDSRSTLTASIDQPEMVQPSFTEETAVPAPGANVEIQVRPRSERSCIKDGRIIRVVFLGSADFDVLNIDQTTLSFAGLDVSTRRSGPLCTAFNSSADEYLDLMCRFKHNSDDFEPDSSDQATASGVLIDGRPFQGSDSICLSSR